MAPARPLGGRPSGHLEPAQPVDHPSSLGDKVVAVVGEQPDLASNAVEAGGGQVGLAQRGAGDGASPESTSPATSAGGRTAKPKNDNADCGTRTSIGPAPNMRILGAPSAH